METTTQTTRMLDIDGMTGDACVDKVSGALKGVKDVTTKSVKVGSATIGADQAGCKAACAAIDTAGYPARERNSGQSGRASDGDTKPYSVQGQKGQSEQKQGDQTRMPTPNPAVANGDKSNGADRSNTSTPAKPAVVTT